MFKYFEYGIIFIFLLVGFFVLIWKLEVTGVVKKTLEKARLSVEEKDRRVKIQRRKNLSEFQKENSIWLYIESQIVYSGLSRRFKWISAGKLLVINAMSFVAALIIGITLKNLPIALWVDLGFIIFQFISISILKARNLKIVNEELPKFFDFLGSYSLSSGELISIFSQISRYLRDPLAIVLEECVAESRMSSEPSIAILNMAEKVEHPQFKQFVRNIEITSRYSADFNTLVSDSRKSMREYISQTHDRRGLLREAGINMGLLLIMAVVVLLTVNVLVDGNVWLILFRTMVGHIALGVTGFILILFGLQVFSMDK